MSLTLRKRPPEPSVAERRAAEPSLVIVGRTDLRDLGTHHGRIYVTVDGQPLLAGSEFELLVDQPVLELRPGNAYVDGGRVNGEDVYIGLRRLAPGTFERLARPAHRPGRKPAPVVKASMLDRIPLFAARKPEFRAIRGPESEYSGGVLGHDVMLQSKGRERVRGWRDAEARFVALGSVVVMSPKGRATLAGVVPEGAEEVFEKVAAWISAGRSGRPWPCDWCENEAVTLLAGSVPACAEHEA